MKDEGRLSVPTHSELFSWKGVEVSLRAFHVCNLQRGIMEWFRWEGDLQAHLVQFNFVIFTLGSEGQVGLQENKEKLLPKSHKGYLLLVKQKSMA